ncbi:MAG: hypothetical protein ACYTAN_16295, partial [Planctomycetota bacterium]
SKSAEFLAAARTLENFARSVRPPIRVLATARAAMHFCDAGDVTHLPWWGGRTEGYDVVVLQLHDDWGQKSVEVNRAYETFTADGAFHFYRVGDYRVGDFVILLKDPALLEAFL